MKSLITRQSVLLTLLLLCTASSMATILRVNNKQGLTGVYSTVQAAHDAAVAGDTILVEPSPNSYGNLTATKKIILIGTGYFLTENPETQWKDAWPATLGTVTFSKTTWSTSEFSQMMGFTCTANLTVYVPNITIRRNYLQGSTNLVQQTESIANILFAENFCTKSLNMSGQTHDIVIRNNIFYFASSYYSISGGTNYNGLFMNNLVIGHYYYTSYINIDNFLVQNNITSYISFYTNYNSVFHNIADNTAFGNQNGNMQNVSMSSVFLYTGSTDGMYQLKANSPAIGAGIGGADCGAFGGPNPYILSGMPPVPATYYFMIGDPNGPYNVHVKVKSHN